MTISYINPADFAQLQSDVFGILSKQPGNQVLEKIALAVAVAHDTGHVVSQVMQRGKALGFVSEDFVGLMNEVFDSIEATPETDK